jgi:hypothetical protein
MLVALSIAKKHSALSMPLIASGNIKERTVEPTEIIAKAVDKLGSIEDAGPLQAAVPDLIGILSASMAVPDLTSNGFGLAIIELSKSILKD